MNKYNQLREEIIKAVPEIAELKFGCEFEYKNKIYKFINLNKEGYIIALTIDNTITTLQADLRDIKIIGRDIQLEDCLIAIPEEKNIYVSAWTGLFSVWSRALNEMVSQHTNWKPNKPLQDQSDEVHNLLWDLIYKK